MTADEYVKDRLEDQIGWYDRKSLSAQRNFKYVRVAEITCAAVIPLLAGYADSTHPSIGVTIGVLGAVVAILAGLLGLYQFEHHWVEYRTTCESLKKEKYLFLTASEPYDQEADERFALLVQRVETLVSKENTNWAQYMMKPRDDGDST